jgi:hypothetical protein
MQMFLNEMKENIKHMVTTQYFETLLSTGMLDNMNNHIYQIIRKVQVLSPLSSQQL